MLDPDATSVSDPVRVSIRECAAFTRLMPRVILFEMGSSGSVSLLELPSRTRVLVFGSSGASGAVANATGRERYSSMPSVAFQNWWNASPGSLFEQRRCQQFRERYSNRMSASRLDTHSLSQEHKRFVHRMLRLLETILRLG